jgi:protein gp37
MSDLFHPDVPFEYIDKIFAVMQASPHHTFQILTKRPERALEWFKGAEVRVEEAGDELAGNKQWCHAHQDRPWPLSNVWMGISAEDQESYDARIDYLIQIPAVTRWISYEPAIGPINFGFLGIVSKAIRSSYTPLYELLDWIVVGGESGTKNKARPFHIDWARSTIHQCAEVDVACFVKQMGTVPYQDDEFPEDTPYAGIKLIGGVEKPGLCFPGTKGKKGGDMEQWPEELRCREHPNIEEAT